MISIPFSTIKSGRTELQAEDQLAFQFHLVRLKDGHLIELHLLYEFQFHLVRLKVCGRFVKTAISTHFNSI